MSQKKTPGYFVTTAPITWSQQHQQRSDSRAKRLLRLGWVGRGCISRLEGTGQCRLQRVRPSACNSILKPFIYNTIHGTGESQVESRYQAAALELRPLLCLLPIYGRGSHYYSSSMASRAQETRRQATQNALVEYELAGVPRGTGQDLTDHTAVVGASWRTHKIFFAKWESTFVSRMMHEIIPSIGVYSRRVTYPLKGGGKRQ